MPIDLIINNITGTPLYDVYVCDCLKINCYLVGSGINIPPPYQFTIPNELSNETCFLVKTIDSVGCIIEEIIDTAPKSGNTIWQFVPGFDITPTPTPTVGYIPPTPTVTRTPKPTPTMTRSTTPTPTVSRSVGSQPQNVIFVHIPSL